MEGQERQEILSELKQMNKTMLEMQKDTNYQLRRIATRLEEMNH